MIPIIWVSRTGIITLIEVRSVTAWGEEGRLTEKGQKETFWDDGYVGVYICQNSSNYTFSICAFHCM